jgi:SAM-dependent methyltransferase
MEIPIEQHNIEIRSNRKAWDRKPVLQQAYTDFYKLIKSQVDQSAGGLIVELGSGIGIVKNFIPECITTDIFPNQWLDRQENAYKLSFEDNSISTLILFDVWHHLRYPGTALIEFRRVLKPDGKIILFEPAASLSGRFVYGLFHHEPLGLNVPITWEAPADFDADDMDYFAAQGAASRIFWWKKIKDWQKEWDLVLMKPIASFAYFLSGGFSKKQIGGITLYNFVNKCDKFLSLMPHLFAARLFIVLKKKG